MRLAPMIFAGFVSGCSLHDGGDAAAVSYYRDVAPILAANCWACHGDNGIAFRTEGYEYAAANSALIAKATASGRMPPWPPSDTCAPLQHVRALTDEEKATLAEWDALGAPEGDPADMPTIHVDDPAQSDILVGMDDAYTPESLTDDYRCFVLDPALTEDAWVTAVQVVPGNTQIVHHVILYMDPSGHGPALDAAEPGAGYTCFGDPGFSDTGILGGWVPGTSRTETPTGTGVPLAAGEKIVMQVHYYPANDPGGSDETVVGLDLSDEPVKSLVSFPIADFDLNIPAGASAHAEGLSFTNEFGVGVDVYGVTPHMHLLGSKIEVMSTKSDGEETCWVDIDDWDFQYQEFYWFQDPIRFDNGDRLDLRCTFDNSTANPDNPSDPPTMVHWGEGTADEMCLAFITFAI